MQHRPSTTSCGFRFCNENHTQYALKVKMKLTINNSIAKLRLSAPDIQELPSLAASS